MITAALPYTRHMGGCYHLSAMLLACALCVQIVAAVQEGPARAKDIYAHAIELEARGNGAAALPLLWEAAALAPHDADIQNRLGEALERIGALDGALDAYRAALTARPSFRKASNNLILALVKAGRAEEAVTRARALADASPQDAERRFTLGLAQSDVDVAGAIASFRRVLDLDPRHTLARYNLALVLYRADRLSDAAGELRRALAQELRPEAYYTLGCIALHQGDLDGAAGALREAVAARPDYADAYVTLGSVLKEKRDWKGAIGALRRAVALRPDAPAAHYALGQVLQLSGDETAARAAFADAERLRRLTEASQAAAVLTAAGTQRFDAADVAGALDCFRRATAVSDAYAPAHYQMGRALERLGQHEAARAAFARAQRLNPGLVPPGTPR